MAMLLASPATAGLNTWTAIGPTGGSIRALLFDPGAGMIPPTVYAGTLGSGVWKSTNDGTTWVQSDPTGPLATRTVRALVSGTPGTIYAGVEDPANAPSGGVFVSTDGGLTWDVLDTNPSTLTNKKVLALAYDSVNQVLYAGVEETTIDGVTFPGGVFKWDGVEWTLLNTGLESDPGQCNACARQVQALALDTRKSPPVIYAGTNGVGVYKSVDGGQTWIRPSAKDEQGNEIGLSNQGFRSDCLGSSNLDKIEVLSLAVDLTIPEETVYAGVTGQVGNTGCHPTYSEGGHQGQGAGFFRYGFSPSDNKFMWDRKMAGELEELVPITGSTNVWAIAMLGATIYIGTDIGVYRSTDSASNWDRLPQPVNPSGLTNLPVRALAVDPTGDVTLYAGTNGRGVFRRSPPNNAASVGPHPWVPVNTGLTALRAQSVAVGTQAGFKTILGGINSGGIVTSTDGGSTWQGSPDPTCPVVASDPGSSCRTVLDIATDPTNLEVVYAGTGRGVIKSVDGGLSWISASTGLPTTTSDNPNDPTPPRPVRAVAVDPADPSTVYAGVGGLYRSLDGGLTWTSANGNLGTACAGSTSGNGTVSGIVIDYVSAGANPVWGNLYVATDGSGVCRSTDGGATWTAMNGGILPADLNILALAFDPLPPATLYAGTATGKVYKIQIGQASWTSFSSGLPALPINGLVVRLGAPSNIYASTNGAGIYTVPANSAPWSTMNGGLTSLAVAGIGFDPDGSGTLYAATLGRGFSSFEFAPTGTPPFVIINSPPPPTFSTATTPVAISGTTIGGQSVFWSTNRGKAGFASLIGSSWSASVPLEPGPNVITVTAVDGSFNRGSQVITVTLILEKREEDFNGDGKADILWRHSSGQLAIWLMNGTTIATSGSPGSADNEWVVEQIGDFNGDGKADILWRHSDGQLVIWLMNGFTLIAPPGSPGNAPAGWAIQGVGDFNGDGKADILWRHSSGLVAIWFMNGTSAVDFGFPGSAAPDWSIAGVGDFNGDGKADILWRHSGGLIAVWLMNGGVVTGSGFPAGVGPDWVIQGIGDFNGDGNADVLWRQTSGLVYIWLMNGATITSAGAPAGVDLNWTIQHPADFNGDGKADILWRHSSGQVFVWLMNGFTILTSGSPAGVGLDWEIQ